ncbi:MAG TPA: hypothetical protein VLA56_01880 [Pseudomonadales bacterium]|nr:hypothetical protein [Pseudomonadales bacterium]
MTLDARRLLESPDLFPQRFDDGELVIAPMSRHSYHASIFTDAGRAVTAGDERWAVPLGALVDLVARHGAPVPAPAFIFHIAHCSSTLLARALDRPGASLVIREPAVLRALALAPALQGPASDAGARRALEAVLRLLGRRYAPEERVVIKANVPVNFMLDAIDRVLGKPVGVLLHCSLQAYLVAALKTPQRRAWAQHVVRELAGAIGAMDAFATVDVEALTPARAAALLWLAQMRSFEIALTANDGLRALDSETFHAAPAATLHRCATHLGIDMSAADARDIVASDLFGSHAKAPQQRYGDGDRRAELSLRGAELAGEIDAARAWLEALSPDGLPGDFARRL